MPTGRNVVFRFPPNGFLCRTHEHFGVPITDPIDLAVISVSLCLKTNDDQSPNRPVFVVHYKMTHVADRSIPRLNVIAAHGLSAPQVRIDRFVAIPTGCCFLTRKRWYRPGRRRQSRKIPHAFRLRPSRAASRNIDDTLLRIVGTQACAFQSRDCFQCAFESGSRAGSLRVDGGCRRHGERSVPSAPIAMNPCARRHTELPIGDHQERSPSRLPISPSSARSVCKGV